MKAKFMIYTKNGDKYLNTYVATNEQEYKDLKERMKNFLHEKCYYKVVRG